MKNSVFKFSLVLVVIFSFAFGFIQGVDAQSQFISSSGNGEEDCYKDLVHLMNHTYTSCNSCDEVVGKGTGDTSKCTKKSL